MEEKTETEIKKAERPEESGPGDPAQKPAGAFQKRKEEWFDRIPLSVKQLDIIIGICFGLLLLVFVLIGLEAAGIFTLFPKH